MLWAEWHMLRLCCVCCVRCGHAGLLCTAASFALVRSGGGPYYTPITGTVATHTRFTDNIVRVGLNYRLAP